MAPVEQVVLPGRTSVVTASPGGAGGTVARQVLQDQPGTGGSSGFSGGAGSAGNGGTGGDGSSRSYGWATTAGHSGGAGYAGGQGSNSSAEWFSLNRQRPG